MQLMEMKAWISNLPGSPLPTQAAEAAGIDRSTMSRQLKRGRLSAENVIAICRAFDKSPADGLLETGYLKPEDFQGAGIEEALSRANNQQILNEISKRLDLGSGDIFNDVAVVEITERQNQPPPAEPDYDAIVDGINAGTEKFAAQKATEPLEEHFT